MTTWESKSTSSEIRNFRFLGKPVYRVSKNSVYKGSKWFFMLEIWPWVLAMSKMQNCHLFDLFCTEKPWKKTKKNVLHQYVAQKPWKCAFFSYKRDKRRLFCVLVNGRVNGNIFRILKSSITFIDTIFEHPVYRFPQKPEIFDFTVSWFELPWGHRLWKYMPLCLTNLYFMANALRNRVSLLTPLLSKGPPQLTSSVRFGILPK